MDVLAEALRIIQPAWQFEAVCGQKMVLHPPDLTLVLSIPISTSENCHLDCLEPLQATLGVDKNRQKLPITPYAVIFFFIFGPKIFQGHPNFHAIAAFFVCVYCFVLGLIPLIFHCQRALIFLYQKLLLIL